MNLPFISLLPDSIGDDESMSCTSDDENSDNNSDDAESSQEEPNFHFFGDYDEDEDEDYVPKKERQKKESKDNKPKVMSPKVKYHGIPHAFAILANC